MIEAYGITCTLFSVLEILLEFDAYLGIEEENLGIENWDLGIENVNLWY